MKQQIEALTEKNSQLEEKNESLTAKNIVLEEANIELEEARTNLLGIAGVVYARNPSMALVGSDSPQNSFLADKYKKIKNDHFDILASNLNTCFIKLHPELNKDPKYQQSRVKSILSREILLNGYTLIKEGKIHSNNPDAIDNEILNKVYEHLCTVLKLSAQISDADLFKNEISNFLLKIKDLATGEVQYPNSQNWQEEDFANATKEILREIYNAFESTFEIKEHNLQNIKHILENVIQESLKFLQQVSLADPPGMIVSEEEGETFRSDHHEEAKGCNIERDKSYQVKHTTYPFYLDQGRVLEKAVVWVEEKQNGKANQSKNHVAKQQLKK